MEKREQYAIDIVSAMAERTIKRLCIIIIVLLLMFGTSMTLWMIERSQWQAIETSYEIDQDTDDGGYNYIVGGDFNGETKGESENKEICP